MVLLTVSSESACTYCVAAHSVIAGMQKAPDDVAQVIRSNRPVLDNRLEALRRYTSAIVTRRGRQDDADTAAFEAAGYTRQQALEVVLGVGLKTLSNYMNHVAITPLDQALAKAEWSKVA